ncbi:hypothetical protein ACFYU5_34880 [Nocardia aobensis]|uniref:Uncharacterized protein n=1 Tax=Nocardia aobensis TaxID=257277 RepID=A0ABW6PEV1_9NOCA
MTDNEMALVLELPADRGIALRDLAAVLGWSTRKTKRVATALSGERGVTVLRTESAPEVVAPAGLPSGMPWEQPAPTATTTKPGRPETVVWSVDARRRVFLPKD